MTTQAAVVLFAHGARDPEWALPFRRIASLAQGQLPATPIQLAFLEFMQPNLSSAIETLVAQGSRRITVVPLFMAQGGHLKHDVPQLLEAARARHPGVAISMTAAIGDVEVLLQHIADWIVSTQQEK